MKPKYITLYMDLADRISQMSYAKRLQVGSVIVKENTIISYGWNGMPSGWENECETRTHYTDGGPEGPVWYDENGSMYGLKTKPEVLHSEMNSLMKVAQSTESSAGATMFCTHAPCMDCAKAIYQAGISTLYYREEYRSLKGVEFLKKSGVNVLKYEDRDK
jgi:dCMP deaminase